MESSLLALISTTKVTKEEEFVPILFFSRNWIYITINNSKEKPMTKKALMLLILLCTLTLTLSAQAISPDMITSVFNTVSGQFAYALPYMSAVGLGWNDAYIGNFPCFAIGLSAGFASIPYSAIESITGGLNMDMGNIDQVLQFVGVPLPAYALDARLGGFGIPFDMGVKVGFLPDAVNSALPAGVTVNFLLLGADVRFGILEDKDWVPALSIGAGVNYISGGVHIADVFPAIAFDTSAIPEFTGENTIVAAGDADVGWQALSIEAKAQVSKKLAIFHLSAGFAAAYSVYALAHAGILAPVTVGSGNTPITSTQISALNAAYPGLDVTGAQFMVSGSVNGWTLRAFGGFSIDIAVIRLDIAVMYNLLSGGLGASVGIRVQT
jgi:hypothetical protein